MTVYPNGPKSRFPIKVYLSLHKDPLGFLRCMVDTYGNFVHLQLGPRHDYLVNNPEDVGTILLASDKLDRSTPRTLKYFLGNGLLTSNQEFHKCQRRFLQPAFHPAKIQGYFRVMADLAQNISNSWEDKGTIDIAEEMNCLALNIVLRTLLGTELDHDADEIIAAVETVKSLTDKKTMTFLDSLLRMVPFLGRNVRYQKATQYLDDKIYAIIEKKRNGSSTGTDLISMLLRVQVQEKDGGVMTDKQIRDEVMTMFMAGHETIGSAMTWVWYLLSQNPDVEARMHQELSRVLGGRLPQASDEDQLVYTKHIFLEAMRLYPPVWLMVRRPNQDVEIGGYTIPAGSYVHVSQYLLHRDPRYFNDPERFDPDRWDPKIVSGRPKFSYIPFGAGKRQCIGEDFSMAEGIGTVAVIAQKWRLRRTEKFPIEIEPLITLRPKGGIRMNLEKRT